jgi:hypothetical protein
VPGLPPGPLPQIVGQASTPNTAESNTAGYRLAREILSPSQLQRNKLSVLSSVGRLRSFPGTLRIEC